METLSKFWVSFTNLSFYAKINTSTKIEVGPNYEITSDTYGEGHVKGPMLLQFATVYVGANAVVSGATAAWEFVKRVSPSLLPKLAEAW